MSTEEGGSHVTLTADELIAIAVKFSGGPSGDGDGDGDGDGIGDDNEKSMVISTIIDEVLCSMEKTEVVSTLDTSEEDSDKENGTWEEISLIEDIDVVNPSVADGDSVVSTVESTAEVEGGPPDDVRIDIVGVVSTVAPLVDVKGTSSDVVDKDIVGMISEMESEEIEV